MNVNDLLGYELTCVMSKGLKEESYYTEKEFQVAFSKSSDDESGYTVVVSGTDDQGQDFSDNRDAGLVFNHILFEDWIIKNKKRI
ncbi:hypothetical protein [Lysinibacillus sp. BSL11]